ncbi:MAG: cyclophilin-like fold protein [Ruminococcus flavefaciens]|nr:cyclophilin-like fold protein [Ruminococcus flavefaciens]MCM1060959.1 cyclophilin-like fold protein [Eubacterium sp.]
MVAKLTPDSIMKKGLDVTYSSYDEEEIDQWLKENNVKSEGEYTMNITVGNTTLTAEMCDNSSAKALKEILEAGSLTINMSDYSNFEKVGSLGTSLPRNDEQITTEPGDLILYQGNSFVIYYDTNSWNFTRLGKINNATKESLLEILGDGDVTVTLSLAD